MSEVYQLDGKEYECRRNQWYEKGSYVKIPLADSQRLDRRYPHVVNRKAKPKSKKGKARKSRKVNKSSSVSEKQSQPQEQGSTVYKNHCWKCHDTIDSRVDERCPTCKMFKCSSCGTCMCGKSSRETSPTVESGFDDMFFLDIWE